MSHARRLMRLEAAVGDTPTDRGSYCWDCGGIAIEHALRARRTLRKGGTSQTPAEAEATYRAMSDGQDDCRRCGHQTLAGVFHAIHARRATRL